MSTFNDSLKKIDIHQQIKENEVAIRSLNKILSGKFRENICSDKDIFSSLNSILYDKSRKYPVYERQSLVNSAKFKLKNILNEISFDTPLSSYCDVGCGCGQFPRAAFELGCKNSLGIDIKKRDMWEDFTQNASHNLCYNELDISNNPQNIHQYELVTSINAFEHFSNPFSMLESMSYYVKKNGYLYIEFSPIYNCTDGYHLYRNIHIPWFHLIFTENTWQSYCHERNIKTDGNYFNRWSAINFMLLFSNFTKLLVCKTFPIRLTQYFIRRTYAFRV